MAVVSDTSPLRYFVATGHVDLLRQVLGPLIIPGVVLSELTHSSAPASVRKSCAALPSWVSVIDPHQPPDLALAELLDPGEAAAIQLASELKADLLLIDERTAARRQRGAIFPWSAGSAFFRKRSGVDSLPIPWLSS